MLPIEVLATRRPAMLVQPLAEARSERAMTRRQIATGVVHEVPADLRDALCSDSRAFHAWEDLTPVARNEWICWIESAKKPETRSRRIERASTEPMAGKRRPCCWPGCPHR